MHISHEIMALFLLHKLILQMCMCGHPVGLDVWFLVKPIVHFHTSCVRTVKALVRLQMRRLAWVFAGLISTIIWWAGSYVWENYWDTCNVFWIYPLILIKRVMNAFRLTVMILSFWTDMPEQTVQNLIRVYTVCHSNCIVWTPYSMVEPHSSNFRVITTNCLGVRIFRKFTVQWIKNAIYFAGL